MKKFIALIGLAVASLSLTGCDLGYSFGGSGVSFDTIEGFIEYLNGDEGNCEMEGVINLPLEGLIITSNLNVKIDGNTSHTVSLTKTGVMDENGDITYGDEEEETEEYEVVNSNGTVTTYSKNSEGNWEKLTQNSSTDSMLPDTEGVTVDMFTKQDDGTYLHDDGNGKKMVITLGDNASLKMSLGTDEFKLMDFTMKNFGKVKLTLPNATDVTPEANA